MIDEDRLICCGGFIPSTWNNTSMATTISNTNIYNFKTNKWIDVKNKWWSVCCAGICVENNRVYVGGGSNKVITEGTNCCEYYDITTNKWVELPNMNIEHGGNPIIWIENGNILFPQENLFIFLFLV